MYLIVSGDGFYGDIGGDHYCNTVARSTKGALKYETAPQGKDLTSTKHPQCQDSESPSPSLWRYTSGIVVTWSGEGPCGGGVSSGYDCDMKTKAERIYSVFLRSKHLTGFQVPVISYKSCDEQNYFTAPCELMRSWLLPLSQGCRPWPSATLLQISPAYMR